MFKIYGVLSRRVHNSGSKTTYPKTYNISRIFVGNKIVENSDVVGASPVGAAPTTSSFSTKHLTSMDCAKTTARGYKKHLNFWDLVRLILEVLRYVVWEWYWNLRWPQTKSSWIDTLRPRQNRRHFADDIFKCILLNENVWIPIKISLKFVPQGPINNIPSLVQTMAWRRPGDKPLSGPMIGRLQTHICVTRPEWVNCLTILPLQHKPIYARWYEK